ncbi:MAG: KTSC domain-containing protein, partial [Patescibacteria group bacterium]
ALYHDEARERLEDKVHAQITESSIGAFVEEDARLTKWLRFVVGLRADRFDVIVDDLLEDRAVPGLSDPLVCFLQRWSVAEVVHSLRRRASVMRVPLAAPEPGHRALVCGPRSGMRATTDHLSVTEVGRHVPVESSSIASAGYWCNEAVLELRFRSGAVYRYLNVPARVHGALMAAESKGRYFNEAIRGRFDFRRS